MNPFTDATRPAQVPAHCPACGGFGFTMPPEFTGSVPAAVQYRYGLPCYCPAGQIFTRQREEWNWPILNPRSALHRLKQPQPARVAQQEPAARDLEPPPEQPLRDRVRPATQEEIEQVKAIQNANRKESTPQ